MEEASSLLREALVALNGGALPSCFASFDAVNSWLNDFRQTGEAWMACIHVYNKSESHVIKCSCASLLVRKVQRDWAGLQNVEEKRAYRNHFLGMYSAQLTSDRFDALLIRQVVLLLVASIDSMEEMTNLLQGACASLGDQRPAVVYASMEVLLTLATEFREGTRRAHATLLPALKERSADVLGLLEEHMITPMSQNPADASRLCGVIKAWIELPSIPGGYSETDIVIFRMEHRRTFDFLLECCFNKGMLEPARDSILVLFKGTIVDEDCVSEDFVCIFQIISSIVIGYKGLLSSVSDSEALCIALVGSALADCWPNGIAKSMGQTCTELAHVMIECIQRPEICVVEAALEYFFAMNLTDVHDRAEALQLPFMAHVIETLAERLMYPCHDDVLFDLHSFQEDDQYARLRKDLVPELLQEIFPVLSQWYVEFAVQGLNTNTWQRVDISLYLLQSVDLHIRTLVFGNEGGDRAAAVNLMLANGFLAVSCWLPSLIHNKLDKATILVPQYCLTIDSFAIWFGKVQGAPLNEVFSALFTVILLPGEGLDNDCKCIGCKAIKTLSIRAGERIKNDNNLILSLLESMKRALTVRVPGEDDIVEAAVRLASRLEPGVFTDCIVHIFRPYADNLGQISTVDVNRSNDDDVNIAIKSLAIITRGFRSLVSPKGPRDEENSVATFLFKNLQHTLANLASSQWCTCPGILDGIIEVCKEAVGVGGTAILEDVFAVLLETFKCGEPPCAATFDLLSEMIEVHYNDQSSMKTIMSISNAACQHSFAILQHAGISSQPAIVTGLLNMGYSSIVYSPSITLEYGSFPALVDLAIAALECRESPKVIGQALEFLCYLPCAVNDDTLTGKTRHVIQMNIFEKGEYLMEGLLYALCETCPRSKVSATSNLIKLLLTQQPFIEPSRQWLHRAIFSNKVIKVSQIIDGTTREKISACILTSDSFRPQRLGCLIHDIGLISRNEQDLGVLGVYFLM